MMHIPLSKEESDDFQRMIKSAEFHTLVDISQILEKMKDIVDSELKCKIRAAYREGLKQSGIING